MKNIASPWKRLVAYFIDLGLSLILGLYIFSLVAESTSIANILNNLLGFIVYLIIGTTVWSLANIICTAKFGGSIGKLLTGLGVVDHDGNNISFWRAVLRNCIGYFVSGILVWLGFIWIWKNKDHQGWHDMIADTYVFNKNKQGVIFGLLLMILTITTVGYLIFSIMRSIGQNMPIYQNIYTDIKTEFEPTPTPDIFLQNLLKKNEVD